MSPAARVSAPTGARRAAATLFDRRLIVNTGKGGVGKTTISAAMAVAFANRGARVLLMELNVRDRLGSMFGKPPVGDEVVELAPRIWAVNTTPAASMREYGLMVLKMKALYRAVFENKLVEKLLRVIPGLPELVMLGKATYHVEERNEQGRPVWDVVIVDAPATGHGMFLLQIPQVISSAISTGRMANEARAMVDLLRDPERTAINLVTLPEEMPVNETIELRQRLADELAVSVGAVVANGVFSRTLPPDEASIVAELANTHAEPTDDVGALLGAALFREARCDLQAHYLDRLSRELPLPVLEVPFYFEPSFDASVLERIATHLTEAIDCVARQS